MPIGISTKLTDEQQKVLLSFLKERRVIDRHELDYIANNLISRPPNGKGRLKKRWSGAALKRAATASNINLHIGYHLINDELDKSRSLKHYIWFICPSCKNLWEQLAYKYSLRRHQKRVCGECYKPYLYDAEWRTNNSNAQKIAQNTPETLEKQRISLKAAWAKPEIAERWLKSIRKNHAKRDKVFYDNVGTLIKERWKDSNYRDSCTNNGHSNLIGYYNEVRYASLLELAFLLKENNENKYPKRYIGIGIRYCQPDGTEHRYYPDFQDTNCIIEVKSRYWYNQHREIVDAKNLACQEYCHQNGLTFRFVLDNDIGKSWYKKAKKLHESQIKKIPSL